MDRLSYEMRREEEQRRFVRLTMHDGQTIYVDRHAIMLFGTDLEMKPFIIVNGIGISVQEKADEIMTLLGMRNA